MSFGLDLSSGLNVEPPLASLGLDLRSLSADNQSKEQISRIASQFEEMLLNTLLKDTFKPTSLFSEESAWMSSLTSLQPTLLSQYLAEQGGLGYRQIIEEQLLDKIRQLSPDTEPSPNQTVTPLSFSPRIPVTGTVTSAFGWRADPFTGASTFHSGVDIAVPIDTPVQTIAPGQVVFSGSKPGYGEVVEIDHGQGLVSRYAHNQCNLVKTGDLVGAGSVIARSGSSGRSTGPHLHLEIHRHGQALNPLAVMQSV